MARDPLRRGLDPPVKVAVPVRGWNRQPPCQAVAMRDWVPRWLRVAFGVLVLGLVVAVLGWNRLPPWRAVAMTGCGLRWRRVAFGVLVMGLVVLVLGIPLFGQAEQALDAITGVHVGFVLLGGLLVAAAIASQAELTRAILPAGQRPSLPDLVRMELATTAVSHTVPGGTAAGTALGYRLPTQAGVPGLSAGFALGVRGIGSALVLNVLLWAALLVSIPTQGFDDRKSTRLNSRH